MVEVVWAQVATSRSAQEQLVQTAQLLQLRQAQQTTATMIIWTLLRISVAKKKTKYKINVETMIRYRKTISLLKDPI